MRRNEKPRPLLDPRPPAHPLGRYKPSTGSRVRLSRDPHSYRGGSTVVNVHGYVIEYSPDHPNASSGRSVPQHRLVMEGVLGRLLARDEVVHHKNHIRHDNRAQNLELMQPRSHARMHLLEREPTRLPLDETRVREALAGRSTLEASKLLGCNHNTLRNRFPHLLQKRRSPGNLFPPDVVHAVRRLAEDPSVSTREAIRTLNMSAETIRNCCRLHEIRWVSAPNGRRPTRRE